MDHDSTHYDAGKALLRSGKFADAAEVFRKLTEADPADAEAWQFLGAAQSQSKNWAAALSAFRKAEALEPTARNRYNLAVALSEGLQRHEDARLYLERALEQDPDHSPSKELLKRVVALSAAPAYDVRQAQRRIQGIERQRGKVPAGRIALSIVLTLIVSALACVLWFFIPISGPLVGYGLGWLVGLTAAKGCGRGGQEAGNIAAAVFGVLIILTAGWIILHNLENILTWAFSLLTVYYGIRQAYQIGLNAE